MVVIHKDVFFANISGVDHGECHLDLYLPDKLQNCGQIVSDNDFNEDNKWGCDERYDSFEEVKNIKVKNEYLTAYPGVEREHLKKRCEKGDNNVRKSELQNSQKADSISDNPGVPFVLFIHGGGWRRGGRAAWKHYLYFDVNFLVAFLHYFVGTYGNIAEALAENSIACAVISYPLTEAGPLIVLVDMFLSYIQSVVFVFIFCLPVLGILVLYLTVAHTCHSATSYELISKENDTISILRTFFFLAMFFTNMMQSVLFFRKRKQYKISINRIRWYSFALLASLIAVSYSKKQEYLLVVLTLILNQSMIFYRRIRRHGSTYEQQIEAIAQAVRWAKCFSQDTGHTDVNRLYLMGHSAGGHLATLSALDESILESVSCSTTDLKGIISISGVYDLLCLNKRLLRPVYLEPTFGKSCTKWFKASPEHLVKTANKSARTMPRFLLMLAEKDLFLKPQSHKFAKTLEELQYDCQHVEICKTNHFNIVTNTSTCQGSTLSYVIDFVK